MKTLLVLVMSLFLAACGVEGDPLDSNELNGKAEEKSSLEKAIEGFNPDQEWTRTEVIKSISGLPMDGQIEITIDELVFDQDRFQIDSEDVEQSWMLNVDWYTFHFSIEASSSPSKLQEYMDYKNMAWKYMLLDGGMWLILEKVRQKYTPEYSTTTLDFARCKVSFEEVDEMLEATYQCEPGIESFHLDFQPDPEESAS